MTYVTGKMVKDVQSSIMRFWQKLASAGVVAIVVLMPFLSLAACSTETSASQQCPPDCPMMAEMMASASHSQEFSAATPQSCCTIESSKPTPVVEWQVTPQSAGFVVRATEPMSGSALPVVAAAQSEAPPPLCRSSQSLLCTFQI